MERLEIFDSEIAGALNSLLGYEMLEFEFVENLVLYCLVQVNTGQI